MLGNDQQRETENADCQRANHQRMIRAEGRPLEKSENDSAKSGDSEESSDPVDAP